MRLVDHQPRAVLPCQRRNGRHVADVTLHREHPVDHDQNPAAVVLGALEHRRQLVQAVVPERPDLGVRHGDAVHDRRVVSRVADDRVGRPKERPDRAQVRLVAGGEHERVLGSHPVRDRALELNVQGDRPVQEPRPGQRRPVLLQGLRRRPLHPRVAGQPEVVVRPEHHPLGALHPDHGSRLALQQSVVRDHVLLAGRPQDLDALVRARLLEEVGNGLRHPE